MSENRKSAALILADGTVYRGVSFGAAGTVFGEIVFTTGVSGFQETLTDPSNFGQIVVQTFPSVGGYGVNKDDSCLRPLPSQRLCGTQRHRAAFQLQDDRNPRSVRD